jgi:hypothetical protein
MAEIPPIAQFRAEAAQLAPGLGIALDSPQFNAFRHVYSSARMVQLAGSSTEAGIAISYAAGVAVEFYNHYQQRNEVMFDEQVALR